jgi:hypothetical protein
MFRVERPADKNICQPFFYLTLARKFRILSKKLQCPGYSYLNLTT